MNVTRILQFLSSRLSGRRLDWLLACVALILGLLPARALAPWTSDLSRVVAVPIVPMMHMGMAVRDRVRPARDVFDPRAPEVVSLEMAAERFRSLYEQARLRSEALEREAAELKGVRARLGPNGAELSTATVVGIDPTRRDGTVRINAGARNGIRADAAVIARGDVLVGIVSSDIGELFAQVIPVSRRSVSVRLYPDDPADANRNPADYPGTVLKPVEGGRWVGDIASNADLREGQIARIDDPRFGAAALGMRVGRVRRVIMNDQVPLARKVEVEPLVDLASERTVVVATEPQGTPR